MSTQTAPIVKSTERELQVIAKIKANGPSTRAELGLHGSGDHWVLIDNMVQQGLVKIQPRKIPGRVGRPAHEIKLDKKGRDRARSKVVQELAAAL